MKRLIIFLLSILVLIGSIFADSDKYWGRIPEQDALYHVTKDWAYSEGDSDTWIFGEDQEDAVVTIFIQNSVDNPFVAFSYSQIEEIKGTPIFALVGDDLFEDYKDSVSMTIHPASDNTFCSTTVDYKMILDEFRWCTGHQKMVSISFSDGSLLVFNVNCDNLYKYFKD